MTINEYWLERGRGYIGEARLRSEFYRAQESLVVDVVNVLKPRAVLDLGCGYGRISKAIVESEGQKPWIVGMDLSPDQISNARLYVNHYRANFLEHDLYSDDPLPHVDLTLAMEVFLHHPSGALIKFLDKIATSSPLLLHEVPDFGEEELASHCFKHDYDQLYAGRKFFRISRAPHEMILLETRS